MTDAKKHANAYNNNLKVTAVPNGSSRDTDARALAACARRLDDMRKLMEQDPKSKQNLKAYGDAIRQNQRLWTIFQVALADAQNPLPAHLKVQLLNLSRYVDKTSLAAVGKYAPEAVESLISINRTIAAGLSKTVTELPMPEMDTRDIPTSLMTSA